MFSYEQKYREQIFVLSSFSFILQDWKNLKFFNDKKINTVFMFEVKLQKLLRICLQFCGLSFESQDLGNLAG